MKTHRLKLLVAWLAVLSFGQAEAQQLRYEEPWRPGYHFSPELYWMNEPNGLIYIEGEDDAPGLWHLFYQHNPIANHFGRNQSWGHATSPDLVTWKHRPDALRPISTPQGPIAAFSGTAVFDRNNTSGLGTAENPPYVIAYTGQNWLARNQDQRLAYSLDRGDTWIPYVGNPVLDLQSNEFRDPKVTWDEFNQRWLMVAAHGGREFLSQWSSPDLINWTRLNDFTDPAAPTGWEVPDLFQLPLDDGPIQPWVMVMTPAQGSPAGGNGVLYWVGNVGANGFVATSGPVWADYGRDFDGVYSWEESPTGRRIWAGIMQSYGEGIPTTPWRGCVSFPRELKLVTTPQGPRLRQSPVAEIETIREESWSITSPQTITSNSDPLDGLGVAGRMLDISATITMGTSPVAGLLVLDHANGAVFIGYSSALDQVFLDTRGAGVDDFGPIDDLFVAPLDLGPENTIELRILLDRSTIEVFAGVPGDPGSVTISNLALPDPSVPENAMLVRTESFFGNATLESFEAHRLRSTWPRQPIPTPTNTVARWPMHAPPTPIEGLSTRVADQAIGPGQGDLLGTMDARFEPSPAVDDLFYETSRSDERFVTSTDVPPPGLYRDGLLTSSESYDAQALLGHDGALYFTPDRYGREFEFTSGFTVETAFRTNGDQSAAGFLEVLLQGEDRFRFALILNEGGQGNLRFAITDGQGQFPPVDSDNAPGPELNLADGRWYYVAGVYDPANPAGPAGVLRLIIRSESGEEREAIAVLPATFSGLPPSGGTNDGRLLIGRNDDVNGPNARTFRGLIHEVRISRGALERSQMLGGFSQTCLPDLDTDGALTSSDIVEHLQRALDAACDPTEPAPLIFDLIDFLRSFDAGCP